MKSTKLLSYLLAVNNTETYLFKDIYRSLPQTTYINDKDKTGYRKRELTKKQKKKRVAAKSARKARKKQRH